MLQRFLDAVTFILNIIYLTRNGRVMAFKGRLKWLMVEMDHSSFLGEQVVSDFGLVLTAVLEYVGKCGFHRIRFFLVLLYVGHVNLCIMWQELP